MNPALHAFQAVAAGHPDFADTDARQARIDARRAFVATKLVFMDACVDLRGSNAAQLTRRVRDAAEPVELWSLLPTLLAAVVPDKLVVHAEALARHLEAMAPEHDIDTSYGPL